MSDLSSDLSFDELISKPEKKQIPDDLKVEAEILKEDPAKKRKFSLPTQIKQFKIHVVDGDKKFTLNADGNSPLHEIFQIKDQSTKIEYKSTTISKYMSLSGLQYSETDEPFYILRGVEKNENKKNLPLNIKVNFDHGESFVVGVDRKTDIQNLLLKCRDICGGERNALVMNGHLLSEKELIEDVLEDEDVLDYVKNKNLSK